MGDLVIFELAIMVFFNVGRAELLGEEAVIKIGAPEKLTVMCRKLHNGTTARRAILPFPDLSTVPSAQHGPAAAVPLRGIVAARTGGTTAAPLVVPLESFELIFRNPTVVRGRYHRVP